MGTVYLHIGMPKAASSTVQSALRGNEDILKNAGLFSPADLGIDRHPRKLRDAVVKRSAELADKIKQAGLDVCLSSEFLFYRLNELLPSFSQALRSCGVRLRVLVVLRGQPEHINSAFGEMVRLAKVYRTYDDFVAHRRKLPAYQYKAVVIDSLSMLADDLYVESLASLSRQGLPTILANFFERKLSPEFTIPADVVRPTLGVGALILLQTALPYRRKLDWTLVRGCAVKLGPKLSASRTANFLTREQYDELYEHFRAENESASRYIPGCTCVEQAFPNRYPSPDKLSIEEAGGERHKLVREFRIAVARQDYRKLQELSDAVS